MPRYLELHPNQNFAAPEHHVIDLVVVFRLVLYIYLLPVQWTDLSMDF